MKWTEKQQQVIDTRNRNLLVSAAAGSGKTAVLVERIIQMISGGEHPLDLDQLLVKENYNRLISCVLELDDSYRVVFEYKYLYRMSDEEIADILGISAKNVNVRYFRARKKLQEMIRKEEKSIEEA